ncbi:MAG: hypothetical protein HKN18_10260 [Silicimonas sp.]|nr:hypothetical protein [Silicimonas sp.]
MLRRFILAALSVVLITGCAPTGGLLVSDDAKGVGGNLFVETASDGSQFLVLDGEITAETSFSFLALVEQADVEGLVIAQSPGGSLLASHQIGREIKARRMNTIVLVSCISACVDVFVAGRQREMTEIAELGLHSATDREISYEIDRRYWGEMGFSRVNEQAYQVPNNKLWVITAKRARELRLATNIVRAEG